MKIKLLPAALLSFLIIIAGAGSAGAEEKAPKPITNSKIALVKAPNPKPITNSKIKVEVVDYSWESGFTWTNFNKTEASWKATVKNHNPEPRHICINYEFLDEDNLPVFQNGKCEVVLGNSEALIRNSILVQSRLIQDVAKSNVVPLEAHRLHSFVRPPK